MDKKNVEKLKRMFNNKDGVSQTQASRRFDCSQPYICHILKHKTEIRFHKKKNIPSRDDGQLAKIKPRCRFLYRNFRNFQFILDDESYFTLANTTLNGNNGFYSSDVSASPNDVKFAKKKKYDDKLLVSLIISPKGISKPFIHKSGQAVNKEKYLEILRKRLIPFINEHHKNDDYLFWPDLATSHYANEVIDFLESENISFVAKERNPPNVPEARPIEDFWAYFKRQVYAKNWQATSLSQLKRRIEFCFKNLNLDVAKGYARQTSVRLGRIAFNDVVEKQ
jgi:transposase